MKPNGKNICAVLKQVRQRVADANGIVYRPKECHFEGDCDGTCPACEAEVRYLEQQISLLQRAGKAVTIMGVALGMTLATGCKQGNTPKTLQQTQDSVQNNARKEVKGRLFPQNRTECKEADTTDIVVSGDIVDDDASEEQNTQKATTKRKLRKVKKFSPD